MIRMDERIVQYRLRSVIERSLLELMKMKVESSINLEFLNVSTVHSSCPASDLHRLSKD